MDYRPGTGGRGGWWEWLRVQGDPFGKVEQMGKERQQLVMVINAAFHLCPITAVCRASTGVQPKLAGRDVFCAGRVLQVVCIHWNFLKPFGMADLALSAFACWGHLTGAQTDRCRAMSSAGDHMQVHLCCW